MIKRNFQGKINEKQTPSSGVNGNDGDDISTDSITSSSSSSSDSNSIKNAAAEKKISNNKLNEEKTTNSNNNKIESASVNNNASSSKFSIDNGSVANKSLKIDDSKFSFIDNVNENEEDESDKDSETESESESDLDDASMHFLKYKSYHHAIGKQLPTTNSYQTTLSNAFLKTPTIETDVNIKPPPTPTPAPTPTQGWFKQANKKLCDTTSNSSSAKNVLSDMKRRPSQVSKVSFSKRSLNEVTSQCHIDQIMLAKSIAEKQAAAAKKEQQELLQKQQQQPKVRCSSLNRMPPSRQAAGGASTTDWATLSKRITINVGGTRFETYRTTLKLLPESRLAQMTPTNSDFDSTRMEYFFDRDPVSFSAILNYYRTGKLHVPNVCGNLFYEELNFWGIGERSIQPCCWTTYSTKRDCDEILQKVMDNFEDENDDQYYEYYGELWEDSVPAYSNITNKDSVIRFPRENKKNWFFRFINSKFSRFRPTIWRLLDDRNSSAAAAILFWVSVVFLVISILNFVLETSPYCRIPYHIATNRSLSRRYRDQQTAPHPILTTIELVCNVFFAIEYVLRFLSSPNKRRFIKNPYNFLEFLAIMPLFWPAETLTNKHSWGTRVHNYIEVFYILRILRIFTLVPKYSGLRVLLLTLKNSIGELVLYMMMLLMTIMIFASFIFYAEQIFEMEDNKFDSILIGLWWAIVTMTTLGYGDIVPVTPFGYVVGGMCALCGLIFMALPIPVIVNSFTTFYAHAKAREKLREYSEIQKNLPNKAVAMQFHSSDSRAFSGLLNKLPINSVNTLSRIDDDAYIDGKYKLNADVAKFDLTQTNEIRHNNNNRKIRCNPFVRRTNRDQQSISHDAKALEKWKNCKRRTIRRFAIRDNSEFNFDRNFTSEEESAEDIF